MKEVIVTICYFQMQHPMIWAIGKIFLAKLPVCTWQKPGGAIALRAPTLDCYKIIICNNFQVLYRMI